MQSLRPNSPAVFPGRHGRFRQRLVRSLGQQSEPALSNVSGALRAAHPAGGIETLAQLHAHLQTAIELEHSTIPLYLTALYTLDPASNSLAYQALQGVVMEEMLHMVQVCNLLNAVGGHPAIDRPDFIPKYPTYLPNSDDAFLVSLQRFSKQALDVFLKIELPAVPQAPAQPDDYHTIGQFYEAIRQALVVLDRSNPGGIFTGDPSLQIMPDQFYGGGGGLLVVRNLDDALEAIEEIIGQGEGVDQTIFDSDALLFGQEVELAHYFRFQELRQERRYQHGDTPASGPTGPVLPVDWHAVVDMAPDPKLANYPEGSPVWMQTLAFNRTYCQLLRQIHRACNGAPQILREEAVPTMYALKFQAMALLNLPVEGGGRAGPSFEYVPA